MIAARACLLLGVVLAAGASPSSPTPRAGAVELYRQARSKMRPALETYGRTLLESLESANPYERRLALLRLQANHEIVDDAWVPALVRRLPESQPLFDEHCAALVERLDKSYGGQGEELHYARCNMTGGTANGTLAARLLSGRTWIPEVVTLVMRGPDTVEAVLSSLGPAAEAPGMAAASALANVRDPRVEGALLRLAVSGRCDQPKPETLAAVANRFASAVPAVCGMAPLAYLRLSDCAADEPTLAEPRRTAIAAITARLADDKDKDILERLPLVGQAAHPLIPALLARLARLRDQTGQVLAVLDAIGMSGHAAAPALVALLRDKTREPWRRSALQALAHIATDADGLKAAAFDALAADPYLLEGVAHALSSCSVRLSPKEFTLLEQPYRKQCARAGSIFMFSLGRDEDCANIARSLEHLAGLAHRCFRASSWRDGQLTDDD